MRATVCASILCLGLLLSAPANSQGDEINSEILALLEAANEEQTSGSKKGWMEFRLEREIFAGNVQSGHRLLSGTIEWNEEENYLYLDGERDESTPESSGSITRRCDVVKVATAAGRSLAMLSPLKFSSNRNQGLLLVYSPYSDTRRAGIDGLYSSPFMLLTSPTILQPSNLANGLFKLMRSHELSSESKNARSLKVDGNLVIAKCQHSNGSSATYTFDLNQGARCTELKAINMKGAYEVYRRSWKQDANGSWFPEVSTVHESAKGFESQPTFKCTLTISSARPLEKRSVAAPLTLTSFGSIPRGASIQEVTDNGEVRNRKHLWVQRENAQLELDHLAEELTQKGFGNPGEKR